MPRLLVFIVVALLVGCSAAPASPTPTPIDPLALINQAADNIRSASTFRISVDEAGPDYMIQTEYATVFFRRATAQYVAPGMMQANVRVVAIGLPIDIDIFSRGKEQYYRAIWTGNQWIHQSFAQDFDPQTLIAENTGFQAALAALIDLKFVGEETLENGAQTYHLSATANGPDVSALLGGLIEPVGIVGVSVYVDRASKQPTRFVITEHDSPYAVTPEAGKDAQPVVWTIDLYDINAPSALTAPQAMATTEATAEATADNLLSEMTAEPTSETTPEAGS